MGKMRNKVYAETNKTFIRACKLAGVKPTQRQASKYRMGRGAANHFRHAARVELRRER